MKAKKKKENRGGKRPGSGQPKKAPTATISFRQDKELIDSVKSKYSPEKLREKATEWLNQLNQTNESK